MIEGMSRRNLDPSQLAQREWDWLMYGESHFSTRPLRPTDLAELNADRLRDFHRRHWRPRQFVVAAAGAIDGDELRGLLEPRFAAWASPPSGAEATPGTWPPEGPSGGGPPGLYFAHADVPQAKVLLGHPAPPELPTIEERVRLEVVAEILAGRGAISRLNGRLRSAEGLAYRVAGRLDPGDLWPADYNVSFDTLDTNVPRAVAVALEEIERWRSTPPHPEELAVVQRELLARRRLEFDTAEEAVGYLVQDALVAREAAYRQHYAELVSAVTAEEVAAAARRHLDPARLRILVVGRWPDVAGPMDADGWTRLERVTGHRVRRLPDRDPLTLQPLEP
jgi:zinc protease